MVEALGDEFEFRIVTTDRDLLDIETYPGININMWNRVGKAWVYYMPSVQGTLPGWVRLISKTSHDIIYLNSLYSLPYTLLPMLAIKYGLASSKPIIIAPRGELSPSAIAIKAWKKIPFLAFSRLTHFYRDILWHASTADEARQVRENFGTSCDIKVAIDMPAPFPKKNGARQSCGSKSRLRIVFLSRISRMKNLDFALRVLSKVRIEVNFHIWGIKEDFDYWRLCSEIVSSLPENICVVYCGEADPGDVTNLLADYDLFFLPTLGENYGHAIAEALSVGTPVLISDRTPWRDLCAEGVGWDLNLDEEGKAFQEAIEKTGEKSDIEKATWRARVRDYAALRLCDDSIVEENRRLFRDALRAEGDPH